MHTYSTSDLNFQPASGLPLVDSGLAVVKHPSSAARKYIQRRYRVCAESADLIANVVMTVTASPRLRGEVACLPPAVRLEVLHRLTASEIERCENDHIRLISLADFDLATLQNWHAVKEAASLIVQVLVRSITNNHSPNDAAKVLFREHRRGTGSGWLPDYLDGLPGITVDLKRCETISASNGASKLTRDPLEHVGGPHE
jgi:hypothetical protein